MNTKIVIPKSARKAMALLPEFPVRLTPIDERDWFASMPPDCQVEAEETWAWWVTQNEEMAWAVVEKCRKKNQCPESTMKQRIREPVSSSRSGDPMLEPKLSVAEAAALLGIGQTTLRELIADGEISFVRVRGKMLFFEQDLVAFLKCNYVSGQPPQPPKANRAKLPENVRNSEFLRRKDGAAA